MPREDRDRNDNVPFACPRSVPPEIFSTEDVKKLLDNKFIMVVGDSVQRGIYKDLIVLLQSQRRLYPRELRQKGEDSIGGDKLVERSPLTNGKEYREVREYKSDDGRHLVRFYFVTRCYSIFMETILADICKEPKPDVVIMNSCLWDISRYGSRSMDSYKVNLQKVLQRFQCILPTDCLFIWNTTLPLGSHIRGGFLLPDMAFMSDILRRDVLEANFLSQRIVIDYGFDVLDLHYYFRNQIQHRRPDGVHWDEVVHRRITNLILSHMCEAWGYGLPCKKSVPSQGWRYIEVVAKDEEKQRGRQRGQRQWTAARRVRSSTCDPAYLGQVPHHRPRQVPVQTHNIAQERIVSSAYVHTPHFGHVRPHEHFQVQGHGQGQGQGFEGTVAATILFQNGFAQTHFQQQQRPTAAGKVLPRNYLNDQRRNVWPKYRPY